MAVRVGKQKDIRDVGDGRLEFRFSDRTTVFDVKQPFNIPDKGIALALTNAHWFAMARELGIETHFLGMTSPNTMVVRDMPLVDLEFITRYYVEGDLWRRVQRGEVTAAVLGFPEGHEAKRGEKLPGPLFEYTTKREKTDRNLTLEEALRIGNISERDLERIKGVIFELDGAVHARISGSGLIHFDGKKEVAIDRKTGKIVITDSFGNADEDRYVDEAAYREGKIVEMSKELFRRHYIETGYHAQLEEARAAGLPDPPLPPLPINVERAGSRMYKEVYERLTGNSFNPDNYLTLGPLTRR
jgi:phosphoribosylaminoimidazole-succinocarboxamide synthase